MFLYRSVRPLARIAIRTFYKKIYLTGLENYPSDKPVILALNHPTAFVEPCILATTLTEELHFLVRGDFFKKPLYNKILRGLGCLPVFRMKDGGYENIKNNFSTFNVTFEALSQGQPIIILAEGTTVHEKRLRPLKKGTARLALGTMATYGKETDVHIVPVGVNYTYAEQFRSEVMIEFGKPIRASDYWESYEDSPAKGIKQLTDELRHRLAEKVVIIAEKEDEKFTEQQFILSRNGKKKEIFPLLSKRGSRLKAEKRISETINKMPFEKKNKAKKATQAYFDQLASLEITDLGLLHQQSWGFGGILSLFFGFFPFILGWFLNAPPLLLASFIGKKKVKYIEFRAPVMITIGMVAYPLWWLFLISISFLIGNTPMIVLAMLLPFLGYFALLYKEFYMERKQANSASRLSKKNTDELLEMRRAILI